MGLPKEPRQKMINLMYLVLTALLALNVSAEILNAFRTINESIDKSNASITKKNSVVYSQMQRKLKDKPSIQPIVQKSITLQEGSETAYAYVDNLKLDILKAAKFNPETGEYRDSDIDVPARILVDEGQGKELYRQLSEYRNQAISLIDPEDTAQVVPNLALDLYFEKNANESEAKNTWEYKYFNMTPVVAALAILNKFQNDIKNTEAAVLEYLFNKIGEDVIIYDKLEPFVSANTQYVLLGQAYEAQIGIGAISTSVKPTIKVNGKSLAVRNGIGKYREKPNAIGNRRLNIEVTLKKADGSFETTKKVVNYTIGSSAGVTVSADKMNLFYIGIENPVTIVGTVGDEKMKVRLTPQGQIRRKAPGKYGVSVTTPGECFVAVSEAGKPQVKFPFRVKTIPDPTLKVGSLKPGTVRSSKFRSQTGVLAVLEDFEFDAFFTVESYTLLLSGSGFPDIFQAKVKGGAFNNTINRVLKKIRKGTIITLIDVYVQGPSKKTRRLSSVSYQIK